MMLARDGSSGKRARAIGRRPSSGARDARDYKSGARAGPGAQSDSNYREVRAKRDRDSYRELCKPTL